MEATPLDVFGCRSEMIINLFRAINSHIITILDTVYHFIVLFRYINNLLDSPQVLNKFNLFSMKNMLRWFALLATH